MPLRDHFIPPISENSSWEGFHGFLPAAIVQKLADKLPPGFVAEPHVHLGSHFEIDKPTGSVAPEAPDQYEYEVLIYDAQRNRQLVAAIEIVSPANKNRVTSRQIFVAKCVRLLRAGICVAIIDLVTLRQHNLFKDLLEMIGLAGAPSTLDPPSLYAASCRMRTVDGRAWVETWSHELTVGKPLPTLSMWLSETKSVTVELEAAYEETCRSLRIA